jgi:hypothetical protein
MPTKTARVELRLTDEKKALWTEAAWRARLPLSQWIEMRVGEPHTWPQVPMLERRIIRAAVPKEQS